MSRKEAFCNLGFSTVCLPDDDAEEIECVECSLFCESGRHHVEQIRLKVVVVSEVDGGVGTVVMVVRSCSINRVCSAAFWVAGLLVRTAISITL